MRSISVLLVGMALWVPVRAELRRDIEVFADQIVIHSKRELQQERQVSASVFYFPDDVVPELLKLDGLPIVEKYRITLRLREPLPMPKSKRSARRYYVRLAKVFYEGADEPAAPFESNSVYLPNLLEVTLSQEGKSDAESRRLLTLEPSHIAPEELDWLKDVKPEHVLVQLKQRVIERGEKKDHWNNLTVSAVTKLPFNRGVEATLRNPLPRGRSLVIQSSITDGSWPQLSSDPTEFRFEIPGKDFAWLDAELALLVMRGGVSRSYDSEFLMDLTLAPKLREWTRGSNIVRLAPRLRANVGSDNPRRSESPNSIVASGGVEIDNYFRREFLNEIVTRVDVRLETDRDFDYRNVVSGFESQFRFRNFVQSREYIKAQCGPPDESSQSKTIHRGRWCLFRSWSILPRVGYDAGRSDRKGQSAGLGTTISRLKSGLNVAVGVGPFILRFDQGYWWLHNESTARHRHYLEAAVELPLRVAWSGKHGLAWKFRRGEQPPFASRTDVFSLSYQVRY